MDERPETRQKRTVALRRIDDILETWMRRDPNLETLLKLHDRTAHKAYVLRVREGHQNSKIGEMMGLRPNRVADLIRKARGFLQRN